MATRTTDAMARRATRARPLATTLLELVWVVQGAGPCETERTVKRLLRRGVVRLTGNFAGRESEVAAD